jgi:hypothetical protein
VNAVASPFFYIAGYLQLAIAVNKEVADSDYSSIASRIISNHTNYTNEVMNMSNSSSNSSIIISDNYYNHHFNISSNVVMLSSAISSSSSSSSSSISSSSDGSDDDHGGSSIDMAVFWWLIIAALVLGFANGLGSGLVCYMMYLVYMGVSVLRD